jgi:hypothetical protein
VQPRGTPTEGKIQKRRRHLRESSTALNSLCLLFKKIACTAENSLVRKYRGKLDVRDVKQLIKEVAMSNKIKKMFLLFVIISLTGCAGASNQWKDKSGVPVSDTDLAACELQAGGYGTAQASGAIGPFHAKIAACLTAKGYTKPE